MVIFPREALTTVPEIPVESSAEASPAAVVNTLLLFGATMSSSPRGNRGAEHPATGAISDPDGVFQLFDPTTFARETKKGRERERESSFQDECSRVL